MGCSPRRLEGRKNGKRKGYGLARSVRNAVNTSALILQLPADQPIGSATHFGLPPTWVCVCGSKVYSVLWYLHSFSWVSVIRVLRWWHEKRMMSGTDRLILLGIKPDTLFSQSVTK